MTRRPRHSKRLGLLALASVAALGAFASSAFGAPPGTTFDTASVDGNVGEWTDADFFADMYRAGDPTKQVESKLYLRYDCTTKVLYARVAVVGNVTIKADLPSDSFIKLGNPIKLVDGNSGDNDIAPDFAWVGLMNNGTIATGWEASTPLAEGSYSNLNIHAQVESGGSQTSAVAGRAIPLLLNCPPVGESSDPLVTKTATASFDRTFDWSIEKVVLGGSTKTAGADGNATFTYKVDATKGAAADSNFKVTGTISVVNPGATRDIFIEDDILGRTDETCVVAGANQAGTWTVPGQGATTNFSYSCTLPTGGDGTNQVRISTPLEDTLPLPGQPIDSFDVPFFFVTPTTVTNNSVDVTDAFNGAAAPGGPLSGGNDITETTSFTYDRPVTPQTTCPAYTTYSNTAYITYPSGASENASASVQACRPATALGGSTSSTPTTNTTTNPTNPAAAAAGTVASPRARLRVTKTGPRAATAGQIVTYTITVRNTGRVSAAAVVLRDVLPSGFTVSGRVKGATFTGGALSWRVGALAAGKSRTVKASFRIDRSIGGRRCNVASASARGVAAVRATACTRIAAVAGAVEPAVTG
jgi:uncharacterized repeat protein (TIGR01451 family)